MQGRQHRRYGQDGGRQRVRNGGLNDYVGSMAKCTVGLNCSTVRMRMPDLHDRGASNECTAQEAKGHPERMTCSLIETAT